MQFSYRHLYYFWVVGKEGGITRAAERLGMAVQTVSTQVRELERSLGHSLLKPEGRKLLLTEAGEAAMRQAELIFALGEGLPRVVHDAVSEPRVRLAVGVSDGVPKLVARRLLQPALEEPRLRLLCHEGEVDDLVAELAMHRLDVVLTDRAVVPTTSLKLHSHVIGASDFAWYASPRLADVAMRDFPQSLARVPVLLPTTHVAARVLIDHWFERQGVRPYVAGEFEDSALLATFGAAGMGVFPAATLVDAEFAATHGVSRIGACEGVEERYFALSTHRKVPHPLVQRMLLGPTGARAGTP